MRTHAGPTRRRQGLDHPNRRRHHSPPGRLSPLDGPVVGRPRTQGHRRVELLPLGRDLPRGTDCAAADLVEDLVVAAGVERRVVRPAECVPECAHPLARVGRACAVGRHRTVGQPRPSRPAVFPAHPHPVGRSSLYLPECPPPENALQGLQEQRHGLLLSYRPPTGLGTPHALLRVLQRTLLDPSAGRGQRHPHPQGHPHSGVSRHKEPLGA